MGFASVYRSLTEIFPQVDARILRAVAIEHPKDADEAAAVVLSEIVPSLPTNSSHNFTPSWNKSSGSISEREVERDLEDVVSRCRGFLVASGSKSTASSSSETIPLAAARGYSTSAPRTKLVSSRNELTTLPLNVGRGSLVASGSKSITSSSSSESTPLVAARGYTNSAPSTKLVSRGNELTTLPLNVGHGFHVAYASKPIVSSSSETIPLLVGRAYCTSAPSTKLVSSRHELTTLPLNVGRGVYHKDVECDEVQSLKKAPGKEHENYDFFGKCFDVPSEAQIGSHEPEDDVASVVSGVAQENVKSTSDFWQDLDFHMTWNHAESSTSRGSGIAVQKLNQVDLTSGDNMVNIQQGSGSEVGSGSTNVVDETSNGSVASGNGDTELGGAFSTSTHGCNVDHLEEIIEDAKSNKKTLLTVMESVMNLMREVELEENDVEKLKEEAAKGGLDMLEKVEDLKKMLDHAKEANDMHAGEVYGEKSILATEVKELENRLLNLSEERNKSLAVLDEMRGTLETRLAEALEMKKAGEGEKKEKEDSALKALAEQEAIMEKVAQESKVLQQEAEENSKLREFLMDRGQIVDSLQGEISVICQDVRLLKEKFDNRVSLTKSVSSSSSSQTSSCASFMRSLVLENPSEKLNGALETSSNNKSPEAAEKNYQRELLEDGWDLFDKDFEL